MKVKAMRDGGGLLDLKPQLGTERVINWIEKGSRTNFKLLCLLLKGNAIPADTLNLYCENRNRNKRFYVIFTT